MEINMTETCMYSMEDDPLASQKSKGQPFFACYLLCSLSSRHKGCTYIGFTVNPRRRIRQHNGEIKSGAHQTKRKRPWEMILCIYGFPSQVSALQFEWAWQHPKESLAVKEAVKGLKQKQLGGIAGHTKGCPTLPSHMKVQICPVDELPCYTDNWLSDGEDDLEEEHCFGTSDISDPEEEVKGEKDLAYQKKSTEIEKQQEQECDQQPCKKSRRRGRPSKQLKSSLSADELGSKITVPSSRKLSSSTLQADAKTKGSNRLNSFFSNHDCLLKISDSENSEDSHSASGSSSMPNSSLPVNLRQETSNAVENNWSINYRTDCCLAKGSKAEMSKDISDDFSIKNKMIAASDPVEYKLSNDLKIDYIVAEDSEVDQIINNIDDFSIKRITTTSSNTIEFPSLQEYSPVCYISPLKTSEEALLSFTSPCKSTPTEKLINVNYSFLSPVACQGQVITILSTPRPISRGVIDLTDSPAT